MSKIRLVRLCFKGIVNIRDPGVRRSQTWGNIAETWGLEPRAYLVYCDNLGLFRKSPLSDTAIRNTLDFANRDSNPDLLDDEREHNL